MGAGVVVEGSREDSLIAGSSVMDTSVLFGENMHTEDSGAL
jgi:hypothetical protein